MIPEKKNVDLFYRIQTTWQKLDKTAPSQVFSRYLYIWIFAAFIFFGFLLNLINNVLKAQIEGMSQDARQLALPEPVSSKAETPHEKFQALRIERKLEGQNYTNNIILVNKAKTAEFKIQNGKILDLSGQIPDGKLKFINEWEGTYGFEQYLGGKRDGEYTEYYPNGQIKAQAEYKKGRLINIKSYFYDGVLRMEADYTDAERFYETIPFHENRQVGLGKLYRPDGSLKQEWCFLDNLEKAFNKTYDREGKLIAQNSYNAQGELLEHWETGSNSASPGTEQAPNPHSGNSKDEKQVLTEPAGGNQ